MDSVYAYRSLLHAAPPAPGEPLGAPLTRRVVFVLIDALREDTSLKPDVMPFLNELREPRRGGDDPQPAAELLGAGLFDAAHRRMA